MKYDYPDGTIAITCLDSILKHHLATIILDKYGNEIDDWYKLNITLPLMSIPECPMNLVGFGEVRNPKKKRKRKTKKIKGVGIVALCKEAKDFLKKYDKRVEKLKECDLIEFAPAVGEKKLTPYQEFMKKCMADLKSEVPKVRDRFKRCVELWREKKKD